MPVLSARLCLDYYINKNWRTILNTNNLSNILKDKNISFLLNEPMKKHTTFKIGGNADIFIEPNSEEQIVQAILACKQCSINYIILGKGSNVLVNDNGIRGAVICISAKYSDIVKIDDTSFYATAGTPLLKICKYALENSLSGLEFAYGIPGTLGGAVYMNAGAYGGEFKDVVISCKCLDKDGNIIILNTDELDFSYRHSIFTDSEYCILGATIKLNIGNSQSIKEKMNTNLKARSDKQPLDYPSAGSTFKRPQGSYASLLIDNCKLKGFRVGDAQISEKHAGFVINIGNASCDDVLKLMNEVKNRVLNQTGFVLEPEIKII